MCKLNVMLDRIQECESIAELEFIEETFKKGFSGIDKVDFLTVWLKRYYELKDN